MPNLHEIPFLQEVSPQGKKTFSVILEKVLELFSAVFSWNPSAVQPTGHPIYQKDSFPDSICSGSLHFTHPSFSSYKALEGLQTVAKASFKRSNTAFYKE